MKVVLDDFDLLIQGQHLETIISLKCWKLAKINAKYDFYKLDLI